MNSVATRIGHHYKYIIFLLTITLNVLTVNAQQYGAAVVNADSQLKAISDACAKTSTIVSKVIVSKQTKMMAGALTSEGNFYMQREGGKIAIETKFPAPSRIVITDKLFLIDVAGQRTTTAPQSNPAVTQMRSIISSCMSGDFDGLTSHSEAKYFDDNAFFTIVLKPTNKRVQRYMKELVLRFNKSDNTLEIMQMTERNGDSTSYTFTEKQLNVPIDEAVFK